MTILSTLKSLKKRSYGFFGWQGTSRSMAAACRPDLPRIPAHPKVREPRKDPKANNGCSWGQIILAQHNLAALHQLIEKITCRNV
jgi:hypothetical protein